MTADDPATLTSKLPTTPRANNLASIEEENDLPASKETSNRTKADEVVPETSKGRIAFAAGTFVSQHGLLPTSAAGEQQQGGMSNPQDAELTNGVHLGEATPNVNGAGSSRRTSRKNRRKRTQTRKAAQRSTDVQTNVWKQRKRGRVVRVVSIDNVPSDAHSLPLPGNQYTTTLRRRAIRKFEDMPEASPVSSADSGMYGDISLGMKLIVAGGRVIVQHLNALSDGRASPAQLVGVIQRGDVLLAIGNLPLVNLPVDQLMAGLKPLSSPETIDGRYRRILRLRFEAGVGMELLENHERGLKMAANIAASRSPGAQEAMNDMFTLFPMVDQLSGTPLFEPIAPPIFDVPFEPPDEPLAHGIPETEKDIMVSPVGSADDSTEVQVSPNEMIASVLAKEQALERKRFNSEYFDWNGGFSQLLKKVMKPIEDGTLGSSLTKADRIELGFRVMTLTKTLTYSMEDIDKGRDLRSFKTWSTNFSLRSGASARRRYVFDAASLRSSRDHEVDTSMDESVGSVGSGSFGSVDGDILLLGLAAHDDIWRKQVIDALKESIDKMESGVEDEEEAEGDEEDRQGEKDINVALSNELGVFLFGANMNKIIRKKKKSHALPPEEITTVLFDLTTHIATTAPEEITLLGVGNATNSIGYQSSLATQGKKKSQLRTDIMLANEYILDQALPVWLKSFRPLGLEHRRLFWPKLKHGSTGSYTGTNTLSDTDSLTVDSSGTAPKSPSRTKNLQETIEDLELDIETRAETCFLVTYYFTQHILTKYSSNEPTSDSSSTDQELSEFVQKFGTYLQIHSCLSFSANVEADKAVEELLAVACHDPSHRESIREIQKADELTFYDISKLSAVLQLLRDLRYEVTEQRRRVIKSLCVSAYPDVQPWQVRRACLDPPIVDEISTSRECCSLDCLQDFYYSYLSLLLDPVAGHESARFDPKLVKQWCQWSIGVHEEESVFKSEAKSLQNFYLVASRSSSDHLAYRRDLSTLLELSMTISEYSLALDIITEIIENKKLYNRAKTVHRVLECLRVIGLQGLCMAWESQLEGDGFQMLKRVLRAFHQMPRGNSDSFRGSIDVPEEFLCLFKEWNQRIQKQTSNSDYPKEDHETAMLIFIDFMIQESSAPEDVLSALVLWYQDDNLIRPALLFRRLDALLRRGVQTAIRSELSGTLLRLKHMRLKYTDENQLLLAQNPIPFVENDNGIDKKKDETELEVSSSGFWKKMSIGALSISK